MRLIDADLLKKNIAKWLQVSDPQETEMVRVDDIAVSVIMEIEIDQEFIDTLNVAIKALEKQIPKKIYHFVDDDTFETSCCGIDITDEDYKYCPECGQLLGEVEKVEE